MNLFVKAIDVIIDSDVSCEDQERHIKTVIIKIIGQNRAYTLYTAQGERCIDQDPDFLHFSNCDFSGSFLSKQSISSCIACSKFSLS